AARRGRRDGRRDRRQAIDERGQGGRQLADLSRLVQVVALQRARRDQHQERGQLARSLVACREPLRQRAPVLPTGGGRCTVLLRVLQPGLGARRRDRRGAV